MPKQERNIITDKLVVEKTGKTLEHWFLTFDKEGAKKLSHQDIYNLASEIKELKALGEWNRNLMVTTYEWNRGLKERGQKENGFEISVSKTIEVPIGILYNSFADERIRNLWLNEKIEIRKLTENKSARITWLNDHTNLSVDFYKKTNEKSQVVVQHQKLLLLQNANEMKEFWTDKLNELKQRLEQNG